MSYPKVQLKSGREASVGFRHPWIFSGALEEITTPIGLGELVYVTDRNGRIIATGGYEAESNIAVRVFSFSEVLIGEDWMTKTLENAESKRELLGYGPKTDTTGYRLVFSESDSLPGLIIDRYNDVLVLQVSTASIRLLLPLITKVCVKLFKPKSIVYKNVEVNEMLHGETEENVEFLEYGKKFVANILKGQKTGFFLDQKDLRQLISNYSEDKKVLNLFSYTGATSISALLGGARTVYNIDESEAALAVCETQAELNKVDSKKITSERADVFTWLDDNTADTYDMVILDPPALTKTKKDKEAASKAYHFLNRAAMRLVKDGGILVTSSCSHFFTGDDMAYTLRRASVQAGVELDILHSVIQSPDHPTSIYWPEGLYLKTLICRVRKRK